MADACGTRASHPARRTAPRLGRRARAPKVEDADLVAVEDAISSCLLGATDTRVRLDASGPVPFRGDVGLLRTAITNLIGNALRYSPADEVVAVSVRADDEEATVAVLDRGPGSCPTSST